MKSRTTTIALKVAASDKELLINLAAQNGITLSTLVYRLLNFGIEMKASYPLFFEKTSQQGTNSSHVHAG